MLALLKKDFIFSKKWIFVSIIYEIVVTYIIMSGGETNVFFVYFLIPFFVTSLPFTKIMSIEDNQDTRIFLKRMPISNFAMVFSRVLFLVFMLFISTASIMIMQVVGFGVILNDKLAGKVAAVLLGFLAYFLIQLGAFYKYSYQAAQSIIVAVSLFAIAGAFMSEHIDVLFHIQKISIFVILSIILLIDIILYFVDCWLYKWY